MKWVGILGKEIVLKSLEELLQPIDDVIKLKSQLVDVFKKIIVDEFELLKKAALATYEDATHEESKAENEYDTRGLEASYLAGAQGKRLVEIEEVHAAFKFLKIKDLSKTKIIELSALVEVRQGKQVRYLFLVPKGGGLQTQFRNLKIQIIASDSPLGEALLGLSEGDEAVIDSNNQQQNIYLVNSVL